MIYITDHQKIRKEEKDKIKNLWNKKQIHKKDLDGIDYSFLSSEIKNFRQIIWHLMNNVFDLPVCSNKNCQCNTRWNFREYTKYCSTKCANSCEDKLIKCRNTNLINFGVDVPIKNEKIKNKIERTNIEKYGFDNPMKSNFIQNKVKQTNLKRYGINNGSQKNYSKETIEMLNSGREFNKFMKDKTINFASNILNVSRNTILKKTKQYNTQYLKSRSTFELEMKDFLDSLNVQYTQNDRSIISPKELDFYLPEYNLAIECNGDYWHSLRESGYHKNKTKQCEKIGIQLYHIWESEWSNSKEKVINLLKEVIFQ